MACDRTDPAVRLLRLLLRSPSGSSGAVEELAARSGLQPPAVEEAIGRMQKKGLPLFQSRDGRWRLEEPFPDLVSAEELIARSESEKGAPIAWSAAFFEEVESTNETLLREEASGVAEGRVVVAGRQSRGRGRLGRRWESGSPGGIYASLLLRPRLAFTQVHRLTILTTLAAAEAVEEVTGFSPAIKWPNDLIGPQGKLGGILTEVRAEGGGLRGAVVGVGLNVAQQREAFPEAIRDRASSLRIETGREFRRVEILAALLRRLALRYEGDFAEIRRLWEWRCESVGKMVRVLQGGCVVEGYALGLDEDGLLLLRTEAGVILPLLAGELVGVR
ncbi:BirA family transcriptional regulator, biotin operon repressor / biotin---[acetyl-CoA-carboxylase] ligase [Methylacidimicrobium cyclopophantes]|uniref:Bifunctional ligase/repressor BirA n=1 Tax=Methylacidimicrobium cyclopophantes TaxID=1041766 RepID=A0A5E6ME01_9BACT|nr:biotin--[acetyl-CoA-carboxylase] ligase [Methylacidimicrobium cyclopophantes]VVM07203.1 BirA family transcriptional regulator, biotin operon repressor / biotin---[acetyl-CoA-carboxylase] ligase [Methylacidimicrobium cyclopophantes]